MGKSEPSPALATPAAPIRKLTSRREGKTNKTPDHAPVSWPAASKRCAAAVFGPNESPG